MKMNIKYKTIIWMFLCLFELNKNDEEEEEEKIVINTKLFFVVE